MSSVRRVFLVPSGYNFRAVLTFCRALHQAGHIPAIIACTEDDPIFRTRFATHVVFTRISRTLELDDFAAAAHLACEASRTDRCVLAPTSEFLVRWAYQHRTELAAAGCDLPLPDEAVYMTVTDKATFTAFARQRGLLVPDEIEEGAEIPLPAVAKPRRNVSPEGRSLYPWLLRTPDERERFLTEERVEDFFFQEWVEGDSYYLLFHLPREGAATVYSQKNIAQQPGGKSIVFARGARLHETVEADKWSDAFRAAGFFGLVMIEVRQRGSDYVLIEANPRLWGPLQLCLDGCPEILMNYIAEHTGYSSRMADHRMPVARPTYVWMGGITQGKRPVWHGANPRFPRLALFRHLWSDVYLQSDSWRQFFFEHRQPTRRETARLSPDALASSHFPWPSRKKNPA